MVKKIKINFDSSKVSGPDCYPVVVRKNWAWTFVHTSWTCQYVSEEILFSYCRTVSSVVPVFKDVGERSTAKNCNPGSLLSKVRNVTFFLIASMDFGLLDQLWIFGHCMIELPGLLINRSGDTGALDVANAFFFDKVWHAGCLYIFTSYGISGQLFGPFLFFFFQ